MGSAAGIIAHGSHYFQLQICPECSSKNFSVKQIIQGPIPNLAAGIYRLECGNCGCVWIVEVYE